jgi:hypothetical protein
MTWLIFAVSAILVAVGAVSVISGYPVIQIERGWAEVIAGSVALTGGLIVFALGVLALRLHAMHRILAAAQHGPASSAPPAEPIDTPRPVELGLRTTLEHEPEVVPVAADATDPVEEVSAARHALWKRIRASEEADGPAREPDRAALQPVGPADLVPVIPLVMPEPSNAPQPVRAVNDDGRRPERTTARDPATPSSAVLAGQTSRAGAPTEVQQESSIDWLDQGLSTSKPRRPSF